MRCKYEPDMRTVMESHMKDKHNAGGYDCENCGQKEESIDNPGQHETEHMTVPPENNITCETCGKQEKTLETLKQHTRRVHLKQPPEVKFDRQNPVGSTLKVKFN